MPYQLIADAILVLHFGVVLFVVGGLVVVVAGNWLGWRWVNGWWFRVVHLATVGIVAAQALLGQLCPLNHPGILAESPGRAVLLHGELHRALAAAHHFLRGTVVGFHLGIHGVRRDRHGRLVVLPTKPQTDLTVALKNHPARVRPRVRAERFMD